MVAFLSSSHSHLSIFSVLSVWQMLAVNTHSLFHSLAPLANTFNPLQTAKLAENLLGAREYAKSFIWIGTLLPPLPCHRPWGIDWRQKTADSLGVYTSSWLLTWDPDPVCSLAFMHSLGSDLHGYRRGVWELWTMGSNRQQGGRESFQVERCLECFVRLV